uniref:Carrier domain-containing protein n=1 Tax=Ganoderma boninense TaxID=34458 RepID=A0A5K1JWD8_9APHY|nr:Carrier domain-containing protein [Ganoderma boninense]
MASPTAAAPTGPPYYVLISHSQCLNSASVPTSTSLSHPVIEYHYADDAPASLLPQHAGEHVLVLDYDPGQSGAPIVKSLSPHLLVSALKVADAPGAAVVGEPAMANSIPFAKVINKTSIPS